MESQFASRSDLKCFENKVLHFIHVNTKSLLPKIDELRVLAKETMQPVLVSRKHGWMIRYSIQRNLLIIRPFVAMTETVRAGVCVCILEGI